MCTSILRRNWNMESKQLQVKQHDDGSDDLYIEIPPDTLKRLGWHEGDDVRFEHQSDGSMMIRKIRTETVEIDLCEEDFQGVAQLAHERNITFNAMCGEILEEVIADPEKLLDLKKSDNIKSCSKQKTE